MHICIICLYNYRDLMQSFVETLHETSLQQYYQIYNPLRISTSKPVAFATSSMDMPISKNFLAA